MKNGICHPGIILSEAFLKPYRITAYRLAKDTHLDQTRISQILKGKRSISADTGLRLSKYFGMDESFWLQAQLTYDIAKEREKLKDELDKIQPFDSQPD